MTDHDIRVLDDSQYRTAHSLFRGTLHHTPAPDEQWELVRESYDPGRALGAFADGEMVGSVQSFASRMAVPGGAVVQHGAVSRVGVRADWTRRGVLSALQRAMRSAGDVVSSLRASETVIYGRYGYGVASRFRYLQIDRRTAAPRSRPVGRVRLVETEAGERIARELFDELTLRRAGTITRWPAWWGLSIRRPMVDENVKIAVRSSSTSSSSADDGYVVFKVERGEIDPRQGKQTTLTVLDLWARNAEAWADLWLFVLGIDLVGEVSAPGRPVDEPVQWLLGDSRACRIPDEFDETWLRLLDVPAALSARTYRDAEPVVIGVRDTYLPENSGTYRITADGVSRVDDAPELVLDVDVLASTYLGDVSFSTLAAARRLDVVDPTAPSRADALFVVSEIPWCGSYF